MKRTLLRESFKVQNTHLEVNSDKNIENALEDWAALRKKSLFVDKSQLIHALINCGQQNLIITRPRRWGKTLNMSMLQYFFDCPLIQEYKDNRNGYPDEVRIKQIQALFCGNQQQGTSLKIKHYWEECRQHFANYIVFKMSFNFLQLNQYSDSLNIKKCFFIQIGQFYRKHRYLLATEHAQEYSKQLQYLKNTLLEKEQKHLPTYDLFIQSIFRMLKQFHKKKIVVLVDEYDAPFNIAFEPSIQRRDKQPRITPKQIATLVTKFIGNFAKGKGEYIYKVFCTGIRNIIIQSVNSANSIAFESVDSSMSTQEFYGFLKQEIEQQLILKKFKNETKEHRQSNRQLMTTIQKLYKGYIIYSQGENQIRIFNPYSVACYLKQCAIKKHILDIDDTDDIDNPNTNLFYWIQLVPSNNALLYYINKLSKESLGFVFFLFESLTVSENKEQRQQFRMRICKQVRGLKRDLFIEKTTQEYTKQEMIYNLITCGFLTRIGNQIIVPNYEVGHFLQKSLMEFFRRQMGRSLLEECGEYQRAKFSIVAWDSCKAVLQRSLSKFLKMFVNCCQPLFSVLTLVGIMVLEQQRYKLLYEARIGKMQADIVFIPTATRNRQRSRTMVIHQHKILYVRGPVQEEQVKKKLEQAVFQIFQKNLAIPFKADKCKAAKWQQAIVRGVVGSMNSEGTLIITATERTFKKEELQRISQFSEVIFEQQKDANAVQELKLPFFTCKAETTFELMEAAVSFSSKTFKQNMLILDQAEINWKEGGNKRLNRTQENIRKVYAFSDIKNQLKHRFHGFKRIGPKLSFDDLKQIEKQPNQMLENIETVCEQVREYLEGAYEQVMGEITAAQISFKPKP